MTPARCTRSGGRRVIVPEIKGQQMNCTIEANYFKPTGDAVARKEFPPRNSVVPFPTRKQVFRITVFPNQSAQTKTEHATTLDELAELIQKTNASKKSALPWLKLARFGNTRTDRNCLRHNENVYEITGCEADYDAGKISFDAAVEIARKAGLKALLYTSPSHSEAVPKWRILAPASALLMPGQRSKLMARLNGLYGGVFAAQFVCGVAELLFRLSRSQSGASG